MTSGIAEAVRLFESDVESSYARVKERAAVLREKRESRADEGVTAENSNLTPEQAEAFNTFPKVFQDALMSNDMDKINDAFNLMGKEEAEEVMKKCQDTGLIAVLSEDEAKQYMDADEQSKSTTEVYSFALIILVFNCSRSLRSTRAAKIQPDRSKDVCERGRLLLFRFCDCCCVFSRSVTLLY